MTAEEIKHLKGTVIKGPINRHDPVWQKAFSEHNAEIQNPSYQMGCGPCYKKVLDYHVNKTIPK